MAPTATTELAAALQEAAPEHRAAHLVEGLLLGDDPPLLAAVIGPSGAGKSSLVNAMAGAEVSAVGVMRPTTTETRTWRTPEGSLEVIDAPPSDQLPDDGLAPLRLADVAIVVTSHSRYADAATWACVRAARDSGLPFVMVVNRLDASSADLVLDDVADRLDGEPVIAVLDGEVSDGAARLRSVLDGAARDPSAVRALRRRATASHAAAAVRSLALEVRIEHERVALLAEAVSDAAGGCRLSASELPVEATANDSSLLTAASGLVERVAEPAVTSLLGLWERLDQAPPSVVAATNELRLEDAAHVSRWRRAVADDAVAAVRPGFLRRFVAGRVIDETWRAAIDTERRMPRRLRAALGGRRGPLLTDARAALDVILIERVAARVDVFRRSLPPLRRADPDRLEVLASAIEAEHPAGSPPAFLVEATAP